MRKIKPLLSFVKLSVIAKIAFYNNVLEKMKNNSYFPNPDVKLEDGIALASSLEAARIAAEDGSHVATSRMHDIEAEADAFFRKLAAYVDRIADGNETIILSSGFESSDQPSPRTKADLALVHGDRSGLLIARRKAVTGARSYIWQLFKGENPSDESQWDESVYTTRADAEFDSLEVGVRYHVRSAAITINGTTDFCAPVSIIVL